MQEAWRELQKYLTVETTTSFDSSQSTQPVCITFRVRNSAASRLPRGPEIVFEDVKLYIRSESEGESLTKLGRLEPQESKDVDTRRSYGDLIQLVHWVVGRVSQETFFTVASEGAPLQIDANMPFEGYVAVLRDTNLNKWLGDTLKGFQMPDPDTTLGALKEQSQALSQASGEVREVKQRLQKLSSMVSRGKGREISMNHNRQVSAHLDGVDKAIGHIRRIMESGQVERLKAILDDHVSRLEQSALRLEKATEELKRGFVST